MAGSKRVPSGGGTRRRELTDFGKRFEVALARSNFPTKRAFLLAADIETSQFNRYCVVDGTIPNIAQVQRWANLLGCRIADLVPDLGSGTNADGLVVSSGTPDRSRNEEIERLIVDAHCTAREAELLRAAGSGAMPISYLLAHGMLHEYRLAALRRADGMNASSPEASHVRATSSRREARR
jgi:hypothetical protein